jgi:hypothetical protein
LSSKIEISFVREVAATGKKIDNHFPKDVADSSS